MIYSLLTIMLIFQPLAFASDTNKLNEGAKIFQLNCAGCHPNGNNIVRRGKTLKKNALKRNGIDTIESITHLITNGKNNMSAFKERLTPQQIENAAFYVLHQAENDWLTDYLENSIVYP